MICIRRIVWRFSDRNNFETPDISYDYYDQDKFLKDFKKITSTKLLHLNARSLQKNISNIIIDLINLLGNNISVIGITESWLKHTKDPQGLLN